MNQPASKHEGDTVQSVGNVFVELARRYGLKPSDTPAYFEPPSGYDHPATGRFFVSASSAEVQADSGQAAKHAELE